MTFTKYIATVLIASIVVALSGCMQKLDSKTYGRNETRSMQNVYLGTILNLRPVRISGSDSGIGAGSGAIVGGVGLGALGSNNNAATAVVGAVIGAVAIGLIGTMTEEGFTRTDGVEMIIQQDGVDGRIISVVQEVDPDQIIRVGDRVYILVNNYGKVRIAQTGQNINTMPKQTANTANNEAEAITTNP